MLKYQVVHMEILICATLSMDHPKVLQFLTVLQILIHC